MPTRASIIEAMQFGHFYENNPLNVTGDPRRVITYQFANGWPADWSYLWPNFSGWTALSAAEKTAVNQLLDHIETFLNVDFQQVEGYYDPDVNVGKANLPSGVAGVGGYVVTIPGGDPPQTFTTWDGFAVYDRDIDIAVDQQRLILHEFGHLLGLKHPFEDPTLPDEVENAHYTVMSYTGDPTHVGLTKWMMLYDILALQDIWGAATYEPGDTIWLGPTSDSVEVVWDSGGEDTFDASAYATDVKIDLRPAHFSTFGSYEDYAIAYHTWIENASGGSGNDELVGNELANLLRGNRGNDTLAGRGGADELFGAAGEDMLKGGDGDDRLVGCAGRDTLLGGTGDDVLIGGADTDRLKGELGADTFLFKPGADRDKVLDFQDDIDILRVLGLGDHDEVMSYAGQDGDDVRFTFPTGDMLIVLHATLSEVTDDLVVV